MFEEKLVQYNVPYKLVGGVNFYSRKEIKDILAYLRVIDNAQDDIQVKRIINVPKRGIGLTTINRISEYALENNISFYDAVVHAQGIPGIGRAVEKLNGFAMLIETLRSKMSAPEYSIEDLVKELLDLTGYVRELEETNTIEATTRIEYEWFLPFWSYCNRLGLCVGACRN
jgi:DNA helicase-2/ATP-dependent DNA helicase PcrA